MIARAYGAFFLLPNIWAGLLLLAATFVDWRTGTAGVIGALGAALSCRYLDLPRRADHLDIVNGALLGLLVGSSYAPDVRSLVILLATGPVAVLLSHTLSGQLQRRGLPLLCAPFSLAGLLVISAGSALYLPLRHPPDLLPEGMPKLLIIFLNSLGGIYLSPYPLSGILVLLALAMSCRYLFLYGLMGFLASEVLMSLLGVSHEVTRMVGGTGAILASLIVAGLMAAPGFAALQMSFAAGMASTLIYLALVGPMAKLGLPPLAWPFMLTAWWFLLSLSQHRSIKWLARPALPSESAEQQALARARGVDPGSVALRPPFKGRWDVYQSIDGPHTHQGIWRHAIDFIQCEYDKSFVHDGSELADYYCFGRPIHAPAPGVVVACQSDILDNPPGEVNVQQRFGNYVLIGVAGNCYVLLAHLKQGSVRVRVGQAVKVGELLGACGNSGRSPQPHLHLHVQTGLELGSPTRPFHLTSVLWEDTYSLSLVPLTGDRLIAAEHSEDLKDALHFPVGRRVIFAVDQGDSSKLCTFQVKLDLAGQFWLEGDNGARVALFQDQRMLTCFDRNRVKDELLDLFTLALGVTPFAGEARRWTDAPPSRLLPGAFWNWRACAHSTYQRCERADGSWHQVGRHRHKADGQVVWKTYARFNLARGLRELALYEGKELKLRAKVVGLGMCADEGAPGWEIGIVETGRVGEILTG